ncbi:MAG: hypothetical protein ACOYK8_00755 [Alphaproteobacteria bacterium]
MNSNLNFFLQSINISAKQFADYDNFQQDKLSHYSIQTLITAGVLLTRAQRNASLTYKEKQQASLHHALELDKQTFHHLQKTFPNILMSGGELALDELQKLTPAQVEILNQDHINFFISHKILSVADAVLLTPRDIKALKPKEIKELLLNETCPKKQPCLSLGKYLSLSDEKRALLQRQAPKIQDQLLSVERALTLSPEQVYIIDLPYINNIIIRGNLLTTAEDEALQLLESDKALIFQENLNRDTRRYPFGTTRGQIIKEELLYRRQQQSLNNALNLLDPDMALQLNRSGVHAVMDAGLLHVEQFLTLNRQQFDILDSPHITDLLGVSSRKNDKAIVKGNYSQHSARLSLDRALRLTRHETALLENPKLNYLLRYEHTQESERTITLEDYLALEPEKQQKLQYFAERIYHSWLTIARAYELTVEQGKRVFENKDVIYLMGNSTGNKFRLKLDDAVNLSAENLQVIADFGLRHIIGSGEVSIAQLTELPVEKRKIVSLAHNAIATKAVTMDELLPLTLEQTAIIANHDVMDLLVAKKLSVNEAIALVPEDIVALKDPISEFIVRNWLSVQEGIELGKSTSPEALTLLGDRYFNKPLTAIFNEGANPLATLQHLSHLPANDLQNISQLLGRDVSVDDRKAGLRPYLPAANKLKPH